MPTQRPNAVHRTIIWGVVPAVFVIILAAFVFSVTSKSSPPTQKSGHILLESKESLYNNIYVYSDGPFLSMTFGFNRNIYTESIFNSKDELDLPVVYTRNMTASLIYPSEIKSILEIGFGGGRTSWYLHRFLPDVPITSVELDPEIIKLAHKYFGVRDEPNFTVANEDGRLFLANSKDHYDIILIDAYRGPFVPFHLLTKEFYEIVKDHLAPGGVVAQNIEPSTMLFDSAVATIKSVFPHLDFYVDGGNVVTLAYDGPERTPEQLASLAAQRQATLNLRYNLTDILKRRRASVGGVEGTFDPDAKVMTDDFAPVETLKAITAHNRKWSEQ